MKTRIVSLFCVFLLLTTMVPSVTVHATSGKCGDDLTWTFDEAGTLTISGTGNMNNYSYSSQAPWYTIRNSINKIVIKNGVNSIGNYAFYQLTNLIDVEFSNSIMVIGSYSFYWCTNLPAISISNNVSTIGSGAFQRCSNLKNINLPANVSSIGSTPFHLCDSLTNITVDDANLYYSSTNGILFNKDKTRLLKYPEGKKETFYIIPDSVIYINEYSFAGCKNLTNIVIPNSVSYILGMCAFSECVNLENVTIPNGITSIGGFTFSGCSNLKEIRLPNSISSIGDRAFQYCNNLKNVYYNGNVSNWNDINIGEYNDKLINATICYINDNEYVNIEYGFSGDNVLWAFDAGTLLISGSGNMGSWTHIGGYSPLYQPPWYKYRKSITKVIISDGITNIGGRAFVACEKLYQIVIPNSIEIIESSAFSKCVNLSNIIIPNSVKIIEQAAFEICDKLSNIIIPDSVEVIEGYAFRYCTNLRKVIMGNNARNIGRDAFKGCESLTSIIIPNGTTIISSGMFNECKNLVSVAIPKSVTTIEPNAFNGCENLKIVNYFGDKKEWDGISINSGNDKLLYATINYNSMYENLVDEISSINITSYYTSNKSVTLEILNGGSAHQYYKVAYEDGSPFANREIIYKFIGAETPVITYTDKNGYFEVVAEDIYVPYGYEDYTQWFTAEVLTRDGEKRENVSGSINFMVKVLPRPVTQKFSLTTGVKGEAGAGVGLELSSLEADLLKASASLSKSKIVDIEYKHNADGSIDVVLNGARNTQLGGEAKAGLFGSLWGNSALPSISIGKSGNVSAGATFGAELVLKDFFNKNNPNYEKNAILAAVFILENAVANDLSPSAPVTKLLDRLYSELSGEELVTATSSYTVKTENGGSASIDMSLFGDLFETKTTITSGKDATVSTYSSKYSPVTKNDGDWSQESSITTNTAAEYFNTAFSGSFTDDKEATSPSFSLTEFNGNGKESEIKKSIFAEYDDGKLSSLKLKTQWAGDNVSDNWTDIGTTEKQSEILSFEVKDDAMSELLERNYKVMDFKEGQKQFFSDGEITEAFQNLGNLDNDVIWSKTKNSQKIVNPDLDFSMGAGVKLGLGIVFKGVESESYEYKRGLSNKNTFVTTDSFDGYISYDKKEALDIVNVINDVLISYWTDIAEDVSGVVKDTIENANAWISGNSLISATLSSIGLNQQTFSLMSLNDDRLSLQDSESSMDFAKTVGDTYCVSIENDADIADEDINLNISYQNENIDGNDKQLSIYQWNGQTGLYTKVASNVDEINKVVTAKITNGGQYILGIDTSKPVINDFSVETIDGATNISASITDDFSSININSIKLSIDDDIVVDKDNIVDYFDAETGKFSYMTTGLTPGEHTAILVAADSTGNICDAKIIDFMTTQAKAEIISISNNDCYKGEDYKIVVDTSGEVDSVTLAYKIDRQVAYTTIAMDYIDHKYQITLNDISENINYYVIVTDKNNNTIISETITKKALARYIIGDVNGDEEIDTKDRMTLSRYLADWDGYDDIVVDAADVNEDGEVTTKDRMILSRHLAGWVGYENLPYKN